MMSTTVEEAANSDPIDKSEYDEDFEFRECSLSIFR